MRPDLGRHRFEPWKRPTGRHRRPILEVADFRGAKHPLNCPPFITFNSILERGRKVLA